MAESTLRMKLFCRYLVGFGGARRCCGRPQTGFGRGDFLQSSLCCDAGSEQGGEKPLKKTKPCELMDTEEAKRLLARHGASLRLVAQGAVEPQCEWDLGTDNAACSSQQGA